MGQKVNPNGMRVGINRAWNSNWFANKQDFATFLHEDIKIRKYLTVELKKALLSHVDIERVRTEKGNLVTVTVFVALPGVVIGQDGAKVNEVKIKILPEIRKLLDFIPSEDEKLILKSYIRNNMGIDI